MTERFIKKTLSQLKSLYTLEFLWKLIVVLGITLRLRQYLVNRSLWVDEAMLALNIVNRTFGELTRPLDYNQGAPLGFLFAEKLIVLILGNHDYTLRLFPIFSGLVSIYLIYRIAIEYFGTPGIFAVLSLSISSSLIYYSSELKQYSSDVMLALLLTYLSILCIQQESHTRNFILLGIAGVLSIWVSHPSAFIVAGIGIILMIEKLHKKAYTQIPWIIGVGIMWSITFLTTYAVSLRYLIANKNLNNYWQNDFMPLPPWENIGWYKNVFISLLPGISLNQQYIAEISLVLTLIGIASLVTRNKKIALLVIFPFILSAAASIMHRYPMNGRFIYFLIPFLALLMAEGLGLMYSIFAKLNPKIALFVYGSIALLILWPPITSAINNAIAPPMGEDIKPILTYIQTNMQENDLVYVHKGSFAPVMYYASSYRLNTENIIFADVNTKGITGFEVDIENLKGRDRIWFIFSHVISCGGCKGNRILFHVQLLDQIGIQLEHFEASRAAVYLYNLSP